MLDETRGRLCRIAALAGAHLLLLLLLGISWAAPARATAVTADRFWELLKASPNGLRELTIRDRIDLSRLQAGHPVTFTDVHFCGGLLGPASAPLTIEQGEISTIEGESTNWAMVATLRGISIGSVRMRNATFDEFDCDNCRIREAVFEGTRFRKKAIFRALFGQRGARTLCGLSDDVPALLNFRQAIFDGPAYFNGSNISISEDDPKARADFGSVQFREIAQFSGVTGRSLYFAGSTFHALAAFTGCDLADARFGVERDSENANKAEKDSANDNKIEAAVFDATADFSGCTLKGRTTFRDVVFGADARFANVKLSGRVDFDGALPTHSLDLRGAKVNYDDVAGARSAEDTVAAVVLGAAAGEAARFGWSNLGPAITRGTTDVDALEALSRNLAAHDEPRAALAVGYTAKKIRRSEESRESSADRASDEAEWWLWTWPTANGSEPLRPIGLLLAASGIVLLGAATTGRFAVFDGSNSAVLPRIFALLTPTDVKELGGSLANGVSRGVASVAFTAALMFKLEPWRCRWMRPKKKSLAFVMASALWFASLTGWVLLSLAAASLIASHPTLKTLIPGS